MQLEQLIQQQILIEKLSILSYEMNIYLVTVLTKDFQGLIKKPDGNPQRFRSVQQVKEEFAECKVKQGELIYESPYDEMIGNPAKASGQMVLPINMRSV